MSFRSRQFGFTTIEMIMVMVIIGILAVVAVARWPTNIDAHPTALQLAEDIRLAQSFSMSHNGGFGIERISAHQYRLVENGTTFTTRSAEATLSNFALRFDGIGRPSVAGGGALLASTLTIPVGQGTEGSARVIVYPETGLVEAEVGP